MKFWIIGIVTLTVAAMSAWAQADEYYVSAAKGKGKKGTKEEPVRDLGIIADALKAGDVIHIAAGTYYGKAEAGCTKIAVPVKIYGGYSDDFAKRDPWGEFKTILAGKCQSENFDSGPRIEVGSRKVRAAASEIVIDGIIVDNGERNGYTDDKMAKISRKYQPKTKVNAAPDSPGISVDAPEGCVVTIENCIAMNCAPHHKTGAIKVFGGKSTKVTVRNNLAINNTGSGICCLSYYHPKDGKDLPEFAVESNTILFTWKYDMMSTDCGSALKVESDVVVKASGNVFGLSDAFGVDNALKSKVSMKGNLFATNLIAPYLEFSTKFKLERIEEEASCVPEFADNVKDAIQVPVSAEWSKSYAARTLIDRNAAEASVEAKDNWQNDLRRMLGLPLDGGKLDVNTDVWLHRMKLDDALKAGEKRYTDKYGCQKPAAKTE